MSLFSKVRVVTLGALNDLLDKAIDMNSPSALRQHVRDLEQAISQLENEQAAAPGRATTIKRQIKQTNDSIELGIKKIKEYQTNNNEGAARAKAKEVVELKKQLSTQEASLEVQNKTFADLTRGLDTLKANHSLMVNRIRELERLDRDTKVKEETAKAAKAASQVLSLGSEISIDNIEEKMRERNDVANSKFDSAMNNIHTPETEQESDEINELLKNI